MAYYKYPGFVEPRDHPDFEAPCTPGAFVKHSGIYKCHCGFETITSDALALPPQKRCSDHANEWFGSPAGKVKWYLIVAAKRQNTGAK